MIRKLHIFLVLIVSFIFSGQAQISNFTTLFDLPTEVKETSGLLFYNNRIITHNDSGNSATLYELDKNTGDIIREIQVSNATNVDWEDISQDDNYIYIGDIGNNSGSREDLKIYRITKSEYNINNSVTADVIHYVYEDQTDFTPTNFQTNFDAEGITIYNNALLIFSKNWGNNNVNVYKIPISPGSYSAQKVSTYNSNGLITGATYVNDNFTLSGYTATSRFLLFISNNRSSGDDIFNNGATKIDLEDYIEFGSQIEGITYLDTEGNYLLSREHFNSGSILNTQRLYQFKNSLDVLSIKESDINSFSIYPNPTSEKLFIRSNNELKKVSIYNVLGKEIKIPFTNNQINVSGLVKGIYLIKIADINNRVELQKFVKN